MAKSRTTKKNRPPPLLRSVLAENVRLLCEWKYPDEDSATARYRKLAKDAQCALSQVQRTVNASSGVSVDYVAFFSEVFGVRPSDLVTPYFAAQHISAGGPPKRPEPRSSRQRTG